MDPTMGSNLGAKSSMTISFSILFLNPIFFMENLLAPDFIFFDGSPVEGELSDQPESLSLREMTRVGPPSVGLAILQALTYFCTCFLFNPICNDSCMMVWPLIIVG